MSNFIKVMPFILLCSFLIACSNESADAEAKKDHVWKEQIGTIDKAKEVESVLMDSAKNMQEAIEDQ
jgi:hypothetical protein